ncbi:reverse transcriptase domain-containing protein, partial [Acinetobacter bereziniae]|uniref:reverse transcriptase domain-containing protein n=1 Tax=Acinetobacter bereziniae TaxID=106648 RepID=UPI002852EE73
MMKQKFEMSMMGELTYFLGFQVKQLKDDTFISQTKYTQDILKKFGMKDAKPIKTPMGTNGHLDLDMGGKSVDQKVYRSMIGSLLYLCASPVSYTHLRAHETRSYVVCRLLLEKKNVGGGG